MFTSIGKLHKIFIILVNTKQTLGKTRENKTFSFVSSTSTALRGGVRRWVTPSAHYPDTEAACRGISGALTNRKTPTRSSSA